jgi:hypothetical protein
MALLAETARPAQASLSRRERQGIKGGSWFVACSSASWPPGCCWSGRLRSPSHPSTKPTSRRTWSRPSWKPSPRCQDGGPLYTITTTTNHVEHTTTFDDGRINSTFTATGKLVAVPLEDPSLPSFTGSFTARGGLEQQNNEIVNGTSTFSERGEGSDGSRFTFHTTEHLNFRPNGTVNAFFRSR